MSKLTACWLAWRVGTHLLWGVVLGGVVFPRLSKQEREGRTRRWARKMLERLRVDLEVVGAPAQAGPMLLVANHVSWIDILALLAVCPCHFVAKADVARWPLLGTLVKGGGTLFVKRESRRDAMRVVHRMVQGLKDGDILAVFPEGTTGDGSSVLPFHSGLLQAAIAADAPVQPVAVQILDGRSGAPSRAASYMGDESLGESVWRTLCARGLCAVVEFGRPQGAAGRDRHAWAQELRMKIAAMRRQPAAELPSSPQTLPQTRVSASADSSRLAHRSRRPR